MEDIGLTKKELFELFSSYDEDQNGTIDREELGHLCTDLGLNLGSMELTAAMQELDVDMSGQIEWDEFYSWFASSRTVAHKIAGAKRAAAEAAKQMFRKYDADNSGFIEKKEWLQIWKELYSGGDKLSKNMLHMAKKEHKKADMDGDGKISMEEFIEWMKDLGLYN
eukprot:TRINITY_DN7489_c0_g1_i1.p1 TRINITY_DN7489_c0_g1~~TRINITY_DN7489_c0_g1_i1.p1  ORF type:complete len:166 (-),score=70.19 TRINITY_DN7489_c0_g1_i1:304-801(-)